MNTEINCKECIHYEICKYSKEATDKIEDCDYFKHYNKYIEMPYEIGKEDMIKIFESITNAMTNFVQRLKGERAIKKRIPIKPVTHKFDDGVFTTSFPYTCKCGAELKYKQKRCTGCGQAIDWSENDEIKTSN